MQSAQSVFFFYSTSYAPLYPYRNTLLNEGFCGNNEEYEEEFRGPTREGATRSTIVRFVQFAASNCATKQCVESVVKMCARSPGVYEEEVCGPKKEEEPQRQLLDAVFNLQPLIVLRRAVCMSHLGGAAMSHPSWSHPRGTSRRQSRARRQLTSVKIFIRTDSSQYAVI
ncbi:uncharacterized protein LOC133493818 isoform X7 [Syngnathoides biaculeatus]|uniref:uncharacterized protein LOC133493818 isoform X7 n=1 Tax=Syngnathoides biaculeatus TaxID=300417 RepID=UPI002ADE1127|nr:uncharacterized protein LOC133493818 isoform X7 [Syngnathoides biaculeatus]